MNNWHLCLQLILLLLFVPESRAEDVEEERPVVKKVFAQDPYKIDLEEINMTISDTPHGITVTWTTPDTNDPRCYKSEVQHRRQCVEEWTTLEVANKQRLAVLNLSALSRKHSYDFRIRLKVDCLHGDWSNWTEVQSWGKHKDACDMVQSSSNKWIYVSITVLPVISFLLICLLTQTRIRKLILPVVPDAKHFKSNIMDIDQSQWWDSLGHANDECTTTEIEIVNKSENNEDDQTVVIESMDATPEQHDSMYCTYTSETSDENTEAQCSHRVFGYIAF